MNDLERKIVERAVAERDAARSELRDFATAIGRLVLPPGHTRASAADIIRRVAALREMAEMLNRENLDLRGRLISGFADR